MAAPTRAIRVFVSSTFRDMQGERDELVKRVFPELRRRCEERGVAWSEVDLRWGVTDEEKAEGAVLPICLAEIEHSRPYFLGLLGDRYGWVPDALPDDLRDRERWLADADGRSVTELEILHGVLNDPGMENRAFFYLRDPAFALGRPDDARAEFLELPTPDEVAALGAEVAEARAAERRGRLVTLKERLRASAFPTRDYTSPTALGPLVLADLGAMVDELFPPDQASDPLARAAADHAAFAGARFEPYVGGRDRLAALDAVAGARPVLVTGPAGIGKSALAAAWAREAAGVVVSHHVGASADAADWRAAARRIAAELDRAVELGLALAPPEADGPALVAALADALRRAGASTPVTLVLDGLDQLDDRDFAPDLVWLPWPVPPGVRLVATGAGPRVLEAARARGWQEHEVPPLSPIERRELAEAFLARFAKRLGPELLERIAEAPLTGSPLFLRTTLDELRQHGDHFTLGPLLDTHLQAATLDDLFEIVLARWERDVERDRPGLVADAMTLLWAARQGLAEAELLDLLGPPGAALPAAVWSPLHLAAGGSLLRRSGLLTLAHEPLRTAVADRYLTTPELAAGAHGRLAAYFGGRPLSPRVVTELPWQLRQAGAVDTLERTLAAPAFLSLAYRSDLTEVRSGWAAVEAARGPRLALAYKDVVERPAEHRDVAWEVARLLGDGGYPDESLSLQRFLVEDATADDNEPRRRAALANLAAALVTRGDYREAAGVLAEQEAACRQAGDDNGLQICLGNQSVVARFTGDRDRALVLMAEEEAICRRLGDQAALQASLGNQGAVHRDRREFDRAMTAFRAQEEAARRVGDPALINKALVNQAQVLADRGEIEAALGLLARQEHASRETGDLAGLAANLGNRAAILVAQGRLDEANALAEEEAALARRLHDHTALARSLFVQATIAHLRGERARAEALLGEQRALVEGTGDLGGLAMCLGELATLRREAGDLDGALSLHVDEEHLYREAHDPSGIAASLGNQALVRQARGELPAALALVVEQERLLRELDLPAMLQGALGNHAALLLGTGDLDGATTALDEQEAICRELGHRAGLATCLGNQGLVRHYRGDLAGAMAKHREQEAICREIGDAAGLTTSLGNQAAVAVQQGDAASAVRLLDAQLDNALATGGSAAAVQSLVVQQRVRPAVGDVAGFQAALARAEQQARATGDDYLLAQCLAQRGTLGLADPSAPTVLAEAERLARSSGNPAALQLALGNLGLLALQRGDLDAAERAIGEQVALCRERSIPDGLSAGLGNLAIVRQQRGDAAGALALLVEQEQRCRAEGDGQGLVLALANRGDVTARLPGRRAEGLAVLDEAVAVAQQVGWLTMVPQIQQLAAQLRSLPGR
jgi:ATP/maltotriose-dependent transcriptional regulator MalT